MPTATRTSTRATGAGVDRGRGRCRSPSPPQRHGEERAERRLLSLWSVYALTFGEAQISEIAVGGFAASTLAAGRVAKLAASAVCLATGWRGGFIIPLFFAGAAAGQFLHVAFPGADPTVLMAGCMVATNVGVTKTPLGSTLVVAKMAGLQLLPSTTLAAIGAMVLTGQVNLIASQRARTPSAVSP